MSINKKLLGEAELIKKPQKKLNLTIKDGAVTSEKIKDRAITARKLGDDVLVNVILPLINQVRNSLQSQIDALEVSGIALSDSLGDGTTIGITQKVLTENFAQLWKKIDEITGESNYGFGLTVTESRQGISKAVTATAFRLHPETEAFTDVRFYVNGVRQSISPPPGGSIASGLTMNIMINQETVIRCEVDLNGITYSKERTIKAYIPAAIGTGGNTAPQFILANTAVDEDMKMSSNFTFAEGKYLHVCLPKAQDVFVRADLNGVEIPMTTTEVTVTTGGESVVWNVHISENPFSAGTYNIDFNS